MHEWDVEAEVEDLDDLLSQLYILNSNFCSCTTLAFVTLISVLYPKPFLLSCCVPIIFIRLLDLGSHIRYSLVTCIGGWSSYS